MSESDPVSKYLIIRDLCKAKGKITSRDLEKTGVGDANSTISRLLEIGYLVKFGKIGGTGGRSLTSYTWNAQKEEKIASDMKPALKEENSVIRTFSDFPYTLIQDGIFNPIIVFGDSNRKVSGGYATLEKAVFLPNFVSKMSSYCFYCDPKALIDSWTYLDPKLRELLGQRNVISAGGPVNNLATRENFGNHAFRPHYYRPPKHPPEWRQLTNVIDPMADDGLRDSWRGNKNDVSIAGISLGPSSYNINNLSIITTGYDARGSQAGLMVLSDMIPRGWEELRKRPLGGVFRIIGESIRGKLPEGYAEDKDAEFEYNVIKEIEWLTPAYSLAEIKERIDRYEKLYSHTGTKAICSFIEKAIATEHF